MRCALTPRTPTLIAWQPTTVRPPVMSCRGTRSASAADPPDNDESVPGVGREPKRSGHAADRLAPRRVRAYGVLHQLEAVGLQLLGLVSEPQTASTNRSHLRGSCLRAPGFCIRTTPAAPPPVLRFGCHVAETLVRQLLGVQTDAIVGSRPAGARAGRSPGPSVRASCWRRS